MADDNRQTDADVEAEVDAEVEVEDEPAVEVEPDPDAVAITVNGTPVVARHTRGWIELKRTWGAGDTIKLTLPMRVKVNRWENGMAWVERGPLVYALAVQSRRQITDQWGSFEESITPESKWNYALVVNRKNPAYIGMTFWRPPNSEICLV